MSETMRPLALLPCFLLACVEPAPTEPPIDNGWCAVTLEPRRVIVSATCPEGETRTLSLRTGDSETAVRFACGSIKLVTAAPAADVRVAAAVIRDDRTQITCE